MNLVIKQVFVWWKTKLIYEPVTRNILLFKARNVVQKRVMYIQSAVVIARVLKRELYIL